MPVALAEAHDLVLDRRTVARANALDLARVHRRAMEVGANDLVGRRSGRRDMTGDLRRGDPVGQIGERPGRVVAVLPLERAIVDRATVEPRRRAGLQSAQLEAQPIQRPGQRRGRLLDSVAADATRRDLGFPHVDQAAQERTRRQDHAPGADFRTRFRDHTGTRAPCIQNDICNRIGADFEPGLLGQQVLNGLPIKLAVGLGTRSAHGGALGKIEGAELDTAPVDGPAHDAIQRIDLADQMALAQSADRRIARHLADRLDPMGEEQGARTHPRRCGRGLTAGMATAHHDHVV